MTPIYYRLVGKADPKNIDWTVDCDKALLAVKKEISAPPVLQSSNISAQFFIQVDASGTGLGAAMLQCQQYAVSMFVCLTQTHGDKEEVRDHRTSNLRGGASRRTINVSVVNVINIVNERTEVPFFFWLQAVFIFSVINVFRQRHQHRQYED
ncbi:MAG: hypothetical protein GY774_34350 [Planctomycetes bacterium]|nr:hypothetical protein [Planctomycetota bacterium]